MAEGKMLVLSAILKADGPFRANQIVQETHLKRNLVAYHMKQIVKTGYVEQQGPVYVVTSPNELIDMLVHTKTREPLEVSETVILRKYNAKAINGLANVLLMARTMEIASSVELKNKVLSDLNETIKGLERVRRKITEGKISEYDTRQTLLKAREDYIDEYTKTAIEYFGLTIKRDDVMDRVNEFVED